MQLAPAKIVTTALIAGTNDDLPTARVVAFRRRPLMSETSRDAGSMRQIIGETHAKVSMLLDQVRDDRKERREAEDKIWMELRSIKHDENNREQILGIRLEMADRRSGEMERRLGEHETSLKKIADSVALIEKPVQQMVELRGRIGWLGAAVLAFGLAIWAFGKPIYDGWISGWFRKS